MNARLALAMVCLCAMSATSACRKKSATPPDPLRRAYDIETDWNDPQKTIPLDYQEAQGKRLFYADCVWCHADSTPAGPSNRSNVSPAPAVMNDGATLNGESNEYLRNIILLGGSAMGKSAMMPPYGQTLGEKEANELIAYIRAIAQPPYRSPAQPRSGYPAKE